MIQDAIRDAKNKIKRFSFFLLDLKKKFLEVYIFHTFNYEKRKEICKI